MPKIAYITQTSSDKRLGKSINSVVDSLPSDYWICQRDADTLVLNTNDFTKQCEQIVRSNKFDLVGCMTGRIGLKHCLKNGTISNNGEIIKEIKEAKDSAKNGFILKETNETIPGFFMLFSKEIWVKANGFKETVLMDGSGEFPDYDFSMRVRNAGGRLAICESLYIFHLYRFGTNPRSRSGKKHLK